jgi:hypothetical protein
MNNLLKLGAVALLAGAACVAGGASAAQQGTAPGVCVKPLPSDFGFPGQRSHPAHFAIQAQVQWYGNYYGRLPDGGIISTKMGVDWESCYIVVNGQTILVQGLPGDKVDQQGYGGQTLVLVGRLVHTGGNNQLVPGSVLIVDRFYRADCIADADSATEQAIGPVGCIVPLPSAAGQRSDPAHFAIQAQVHWFGNGYGRLPNGGIIGTLKGCDWESCYIVMDGRKVLVDGLPGDIVDQQGYGGQTLVLVGRLVPFGSERRQPHGALTGFRSNLGGVLIVDRFYRVS